MRPRERRASGPTLARFRGQMLWPLVLAAAFSGVAAASVLHGAAAGLSPQRQRWQRWDPNVPYDGKFTFARIRYLEYRGSGWTAVNVGERSIPAGDSARIDSIEGVTLRVRPL